MGVGEERAPVRDLISRKLRAALYLRELLRRLVWQGLLAFWLFLLRLFLTRMATLFFLLRLVTCSSLCELRIFLVKRRLVFWLWLCGPGLRLFRHRWRRGDMQVLHFPFTAECFSEPTSFV